MRTRGLAVGTVVTLVEVGMPQIERSPGHDSEVH